MVEATVDEGYYKGPSVTPKTGKQKFSQFIKHRSKNQQHGESVLSTEDNFQLMAMVKA